MSIRDAKARFSEAIAAAVRGERVVITRYGRPVAEISAPSKASTLDFVAADQYLADIGWDGGNTALPDNFDDPAFSRRVLGLDD
ncbi:type II toxin-antitoxin system Phd/YefM family antitoxin [Blastomonas sp.]|uniref:type II toxin-antitoxin system Phd/YefM family antitoxin n=1 Tax=Blastomonas sp. TaxID=1909299 RepID=UPI0035948589